MKSIKLLFAFLLISITAVNAQQIEAKVNPLGLLFGSPNFSIEYGAKDFLGIEIVPGFSSNKYSVGEVNYKSKGYRLRANVKYYFSPEDGADKWFVGPYAKYGSGTAEASDNTSSEKIKNTRFAVGLLGGYKWVTKHNLVIEINTGLGRAFVNKYEYEESGDKAELSDIPFFNLDGVGTLAIGYRFGGSKE